MESLVSFCNFEGSKWLLFGPNVAPLVYYSHLPTIIISLLLSFFVLFSNPRGLANRILFITLFIFGSWVFLDSIFWATNRSDVIMFVWSVILLIEPLVYVAAFYLLYVLLEKKDLPFKYKTLFFIIYLPLIIFVPTKYGLVSFDLESCLSIEGPIALYYTYFVEGLMTFFIIGYSVHKYYKSEKQTRSELFAVSLGIIFFLFLFAWGNIIGSFTENWQLGQFGLFGMPVLAGFLVYSIVRFKTFHIKLLSVQALVIALWIALAGILFVDTIETARIITSITLILFLIVGILLVRSVKKEINQREKIEKLAEDLEVANEKLRELDQMKSEFLSLATHQIRSPLTAIKGYSSMLLEGDFGVLPQKAHDSIKIVLTSCENLINIVGDFLDISRIEQGRMTYDKKDFDLKDLVQEVVNELKPNVDSAGLTIRLKVEPNINTKINADRNKIKQVIENIVDNAIKYSKSGEIIVSTFEEYGKIKVSIKDSGVGIDAKEMNKLFSKFSRTKDANKVNVKGTGLGLYLAKKIVEAHEGDIKVESEGVGKGSTFIVEL